ncbi:hypothetical protein PanWU01x14_338830 [Parasponia andersonii]|uniref:Uncharacterized protein n=1 Tax=Parasponia andersonii TaxID=3476 RepID=A0A2P5AF00_PARAD|nr:hypothetical protein PanWU01x14_338830 [Parasponia andersonii]
MVKSSYAVAKTEIARLTSAFKLQYENISSSTNDNDSTSELYHQNTNIIKDSLVVKTKGSAYVGTSRDFMHGSSSMANVKRTKICHICHGIDHDPRNCEKRPPILRHQLWPTSSNTASTQERGTTPNYTMNYSTQDSYQSSDFWP